MQAENYTHVVLIKNKKTKTKTQKLPETVKLPESLVAKAGINTDWMIRKLVTDLNGHGKQVRMSNRRTSGAADIWWAHGEWQVWRENGRI